MVVSIAPTISATKSSYAFNSKTASNRVQKNENTQNSNNLSFGQAGSIDLATVIKRFFGALAIAAIVVLGTIGIINELHRLEIISD